MTIETANEDRVAVGHRAAIDSRETSGLRFRYGARGFRSPVTVVLGALARRRLRVASLAAHPELVVAAAVLAAWVLLLVFAARAVGGATSAAMPGMPMPMPVTSGSPWPTAVAALPSWVLMTVAMMGPAALSKFRDVATLSAMAAFGVAYLAVWAVFGLLAEAAATAIRGVPSPQALALCLAVATAWQFTPLKHRVLRGCLGAEPAEFQPAAARRATSACASHQPAAAAVGLRRGLRFGLCCLGTCWCLMLVPIAAPGGQLPWMAGLTILIGAERLACAGRGTDPGMASRAVARTAAGALAVAAVATLAVSGLLQ
jgi:predicted metal-binding membrane protein